MTLYRNKYRVESTRLQHWDYSSQGYYFVTICTKSHQMLFGQVQNGGMVLNDFGYIVEECWFDLPNHYQNIQLDAFVIMPNHVHGIVVIVDVATTMVETGLRPVSTNTHAGEHSKSMGETGLKPVSTTKRHGLSEIIRAFKTFSAKKINVKRNMKGASVWQPRFYDHIIRNDKELKRIQEYINNNPIKWELDKYYVRSSLL